MRILLINPNTTVSVTEKVAVAARLFMPDIEVLPVTGRFGAAYIASRASYAIASHAALDCFAEHADGCDIVLLACFGDPGLDALREVSPVPVISLIDASCAEAAQNGRRFSIVTGGERWEQMLLEMIKARGLDLQLASIRTVAPSGGEIAANPDKAYAILADACQSCVDNDGAEAIILGGAGLLGIAKKIQPMVSVPLICSTEAGFRAIQNELSSGLHKVDIKGCDPVGSIGLSRPLASLIQRGKAQS